MSGEWAQASTHPPGPLLFCPPPLASGCGHKLLGVKLQQLLVAETETAATSRTVEFVYCIPRVSLKKTECVCVCVCMHVHVQVLGATVAHDVHKLWGTGMRQSKVWKPKSRSQKGEFHFL